MHTVLPFADAARRRRREAGVPPVCDRPRPGAHGDWLDNVVVLGRFPRSSSPGDDGGKGPRGGEAA